MESALNSSTSDLIECRNLSESAFSVHRALVSFQEFYRPVHGYVCVLLCVFGVVANLANIAVLTRKTMTASSVNVILIAVAVADLLTMLLYFFQVLHFTLLSPDEGLNQPHTLSYPWIVYSLFAISLVLVLHTVACWLTVALAVFRYLYIALPTRGARLASSCNAYISIGAICALLALTSVPNYLMNVGRACRSSRRGNVTVFYVGMPSDLSKASKALVELNYWTVAVLYKIVPCLLLLIMTALLIVQLSKAARRRKKLLSSGKSSRREQSKDRREQRTTVMLLAIVIIFIITELPQGLMSLLCFVMESFQDNVYSPLGDVLDLLSLVNNSVNFVLYTTMSKQFRDTFAQVFLAWCPRTANPQGGDTTEPDAAPGDDQRMGGKPGGRETKRSSLV